MKYHIRTLPRAEQDVEEILAWIAGKRQAPEGAANWLRAYEKALEMLTTDPDRFAIAPEGISLQRELRHFLFKTRRGRTYRGIFAIEFDVVVIFRVRGPGQRLLKSDELD